MARSQNITIQTFMDQASPSEKSLFLKIKDVFSNHDVYSDVKDIWVHESLRNNDESEIVVEVFTKSLILITAINITTNEYTCPPLHELCLLANDLDGLEQQMMTNLKSRL